MFSELSSSWYLNFWTVLFVPFVCALKLKSSSPPIFCLLYMPFSPYDSHILFSLWILSSAKPWSPTPCPWLRLWLMMWTWSLSLSKSLVKGWSRSARPAQMPSSRLPCSSLTSGWAQKMRENYYYYIYYYCEILWMRCITKLTVCILHVHNKKGKIANSLIIKKLYPYISVNYLF